MRAGAFAGEARGMLDPDRWQRLLDAVDAPQDYEAATPLLAALDPTQQRELLAMLCSQNRRVGDDARRRAFIQRVLAAHPDVVHAVGPFGETALHVAAYWRNFGVMRLLVDQGGDLDRRTPKTWHYNDGTLPKGTSARSILDAELEDALANDRVDALRADPNHDSAEAARLFGMTFEQRVEALTSGTKKPSKKPAK